MTKKELKFYHTLNQAPRGPQDGKYRRPSTQTYSSTVVGAGGGSGGSSSGGYAVGQAAVRISVGGGASLAASFVPGRVYSSTQPKPETIPYAGIRAGEIIGHRLWWVHLGMKLLSVAHIYHWLPGEAVSGDINQVMDALREIYGGVYCFNDGDRIKSELDLMRCTLMRVEVDRITTNSITYPINGHPVQEALYIAAGTIKIWGEVIEHEKGYRAQYARINTIDAVYNSRGCELPLVLDALRKNYGVQP